MNNYNNHNLILESSPTPLPKDKDTILYVFTPMLSEIFKIAIIIAIIVMILSHYFALFRIKKELIKIRELLENSNLDGNNND